MPQYVVDKTVKGVKVLLFRLPLALLFKGPEVR